VKRVLAVLEAGDRYPSGVVRALIFRPFFRRDGFDVSFETRLPFPALEFVERHRGLPQLLRSAIVGGATLLRHGEIFERARHADVVYLCKVIAPRFLRHLRAHTRARIVLDFGDAMWLDSNGVRQDDEFREVLRLVDAVTTDNHQTAAYVRASGKDCTVIPDAPQVEAFDAVRRLHRHRDGERVVIGWIGTTASIANLSLVRDAIDEVASRHPQVELRLVGTGDDPRRVPTFAHLTPQLVPRYAQAEMIEQVLDMDIGIFPLDDSEGSRVRGILKAAVYMSGETAVIASPIGQVPEVIRDGENGMLAATHDEWVAKLERLVRDAPLRRRIAKSGLESVRAQFRTELSWNQLRAVLLDEPAPAPSPSTSKERES
jgi:glycosyltransferase involved in cell wall biosynthesis